MTFPKPAKPIHSRIPRQGHFLNPHHTSEQTTGDLTSSRLRHTTDIHTNRKDVGDAIRSMLRQEENRDRGGTLQTGQGPHPSQRQAAFARRATDSPIQGV